MSQYIDAIVIPFPGANLDTYKRMSAEWGKRPPAPRRLVLLRLDQRRRSAGQGLPRCLRPPQLKDGEVVALAWGGVSETRRSGTVSARRSMEDPQLKESMDPSKMPFDGKRMFWGWLRDHHRARGRPLSRATEALLTPPHQRNGYQARKGISQDSTTG
jgi:uncharacterized protein YbaA (DUF1428 family)